MVGSQMPRLGASIKGSVKTLYTLWLLSHYSRYWLPSFVFQPLSPLLVLTIANSPRLNQLTTLFNSRYENAFIRDCRAYPSYDLRPRLHVCGSFASTGSSCRTRINSRRYQRSPKDHCPDRRHWRSCVLLCDTNTEAVHP